MKKKAAQPILPWKRPLWIIVLIGMLVFGFYQELAKLHLNHYTDTLIRNPELGLLGAEDRAALWEQFYQPRKLQYYVIESTWKGFHSFSLNQLHVFKWVLSFGILLVFFVFDGLFLKTTGHFARWPWLVVIYGMSACVIAVFMLTLPGAVGYTVAHEFLVFLQSPLPSFLIVLVPSLLERMRPEVN